MGSLAILIPNINKYSYALRPSHELALTLLSLGPIKDNVALQVGPRGPMTPIRPLRSLRPLRPAILTYRVWVVFRFGLGFGVERVAS